MPAFTWLVLLWFSTAPVFAIQNRPKREAAAAKPGVFDYYVMALSWSPQHCATSGKGKSDMQCAGPRKYGFVLHGLWPQYEKGFPSSCAIAGSLDKNLVSTMLDIMPSPQLVRHEWGKHGTCSGLEPRRYFEKARQAYNGFRTPEAYRQPLTEVYVAPGDFKKRLLAANPGLQEQQVAVICNGRFLQEVRVCLDRSLQPRSCSSEVRDRCKVPEMIVRPVR